MGGCPPRALSFPSSLTRVVVEEEAAEEERRKRREHRWSPRGGSCLARCPVGRPGGADGACAQVERRGSDGHLPAGVACWAGTQEWFRHLRGYVLEHLGGWMDGWGGRQLQTQLL